MTPELGILDHSLRLRDEGIPFVCVTLVDSIGSTPQDAGSKMLVTPDGLETGTVGGGRIEARAIEEAGKMLSDSTSSATQFFEWNLQRDIGMTCGGVVKVFFEKVSPTAWPIVIFGAGHITQALVRLLVTLPCHITCIDTREEWLTKLPKTGNLRTFCVKQLKDQVSTLPQNASVICMTRGHATDFPVLLEIFTTNRCFPYLGVIGSNAKAAVLRRELQDAGVARENMKFNCPLGLPIGTNHPGEIAVSIAAELIQVRDSLKVNA